MSPQPELSVIIATHNRAELLDAALTALAAQTWVDGTWDIVVVDNNSTDGTPQLLGQWVDNMPVPLRIVIAKDGCGPAYARNRGAETTTATNIAFLDDDDLIASGWVAAIGTALRTHELVGSRYEYGRLNRPEVAAAHDLQISHLAAGYGAPTVSGGGMGCRRELWSRLGGSDESLQFGEDVDFSLRASRLSGASATFCADARYHVRLRAGARAAFGRGRHHGRAAVHLYKHHGFALGTTPDPPGLLTRVWAGYLVRLPTLVSGGRRLVYAEQLGRRIGRLQGSVAERIWYP